MNLLQMYTILVHGKDTHDVGRGRISNKRYNR